MNKTERAMADAARWRDEAKRLRLILGAAWKRLNAGDTKGAQELLENELLGEGVQDVTIVRTVDLTK